MVVWRGSEILRTALPALNDRHILTPAILARSLLELASTAIIHSNHLSKTIKDVLDDPQSAAENTVIVVEELEEYLVKMIFGTRIGNLSQYPKQDRIGSHLKFIAQNPNASALPGVYDYLCDLRHPNMLGNARFWASVEKRYANGSEVVKMERFAEAKNLEMIREKILWALGWSSACLRNGFKMCQEATAAILNRWPAEGQESLAN